MLPTPELLEKMSHLRDIGIVSTGGYVPERVVTNAELAEHLDTSDEWISSRTGIRERRFAAPGQATSDLAVQACRQALERSNTQASDVDLVICATSSPDWVQPATAAAVHGGLGMRRDTGAMDINVVCSGFVHALHTGAALLASEPLWRHVLVVGAECYSRLTDPTDRTTRVFFGDGAGAVLLGRELMGADGGASSFLATHYGTDFAKHEAIIVPAGGTREPATPTALAQRRNYFTMDGPAVKDFAVEHLAEAVEHVCSRAGVTPQELALVVPHQSNKRILEGSLERLFLPEAVMHFTIERYGNTAGASIPLTLDDAVQAGRLKAGDLVCLVGYGGGLSWAALLLRWMQAR